MCPPLCPPPCDKFAIAGRTYRECNHRAEKLTQIHRVVALAASRVNPEARCRTMAGTLPAADGRRSAYILASMPFIVSISACCVVTIDSAIFLASALVPFFSSSFAMVMAP